MNPVIIIGGDAAGMSAASTIRRTDAEIPILVFEKGEYVSYSACGIPYYISGDVLSLDRLVKYDAAFFKRKRNIDVYTSHEVISIFPSRRMVTVRNIKTNEVQDFLFSKLILATGARPFCPPGVDHELEGVFSVRNMEDAAEIRRFIEAVRPRQAVVVGSGYIGMEMVEALNKWDIQVSIIEMMPEILVQYDSEIKQIVSEKLAEEKIHVHTSAALREIIRNTDGGLTVMTRDGRKFNGDMVILGVGVVPNSDLAEKAGISVGFKKAVVVDRFLRTNYSFVFAAGDCAETYHFLLNKNVYLPMGTTANRQGRIAGENAAGGAISFGGVMGTAVFKLFSMQIGMTGLTATAAGKEGFDVVHATIDHVTASGYHPAAAGIRIKLVAERRSGKILGAQMIGTKDVAKRLDIIATAIKARMTVTELLDIDYSYAPPISPPQEPIWIAARQLQKRLASSNWN